MLQGCMQCNAVLEQMLNRDVRLLFFPYDSSHIYFSQPFFTSTFDIYFSYLLFTSTFHIYFSYLLFISTFHIYFSHISVTHISVTLVSPHLLGWSRFKARWLYQASSCVPQLFLFWANHRVLGTHTNLIRHIFGI